MPANRLGASKASYTKVEQRRVNNYLVICYQTSCLPGVGPRALWGRCLLAFVLLYGIPQCSNRIFRPVTEEFQNGLSLEPYSFGNQRLCAFNYIINRTGKSCLQWPWFLRISLMFWNGCLMICIRKNKNVGEGSLVPHGFFFFSC